MADTIQLGLGFQKTIDQQFAEWKELPGAKQVLREVYRRTAPYAARYLRTGRKVSIRLIWELCRDQIGVVHDRCKAKGIKLEKWQGYRLNDHFHALVSQHIEQHRPEWKGLFLHRERGKIRKVISEKTITIRRFAM